MCPGLPWKPGHILLGPGGRRHGRTYGAVLDDLPEVAILAGPEGPRAVDDGRPRSTSSSSD